MPRPRRSRSVNSHPRDSAWKAGALRDLVAARALRAEDLAAKTGTAAETARRWMNGRTVPDLEQSRAIAALLGVELHELLVDEAAGGSGTSSSSRAAKR